jgi:hypothetical protein
MKRIKPKKRLLLVLVPIFIILFAGGLFVVKAQFADDSIGKLQIFKGSAQIINGDQTITGFTGTPIHLKDKIKVADNSTAGVVLNENTIVRLDSGSEAEIEQLTYKNNGKVDEAVIKLDNGRLWSRVKPLEADSHFEVETPTVTAAVRGTSYNTTFKDSTTGIYVYHHLVQVTLSSTGGKQDVKQTQLLQMHQSTLKDDFNKGPDLPPDGFFDDWIKFNQAEDDRLCNMHHDIPGDCGESVQNLTKPKETTQAPTTDQNTQATNTTTPTTDDSTPTTPTPPVTLSSITITGCTYQAPTFSGSAHYQCHATATYSDGSAADITTNKAAWSVSNTTYGTIVSNTGYYTVGPSGCYYDNTVYANYGGKQDSHVIKATCIIG